MRTSSLKMDAKTPPLNTALFEAIDQSFRLIIYAGLRFQHVQAQ